MMTMYVIIGIFMYFIVTLLLPEITTIYNAENTSNIEQYIDLSL